MIMMMLEVKAPSKKEGSNEDTLFHLYDTE